ncbi:hemerythrin family protein [Denitratisoma sp. agr-D3]
MDWRPEYSVGIAAIDRQHRDILDCLNQLSSALDSKDRRILALAALHQLRALMAKHFSVEETLLEIAGYPGLDKHQAGHRDIEQRLEQLHARSEQEDISLELVQFMREWFITHILRSDQEYARYLALHFPGVAPIQQAA